jgi:hypothetical protein
MAKQINIPISISTFFACAGDEVQIDGVYMSTKDFIKLLNDSGAAKKIIDTSEDKEKAEIVWSFIQENVKSRKFDKTKEQQSKAGKTGKRIPDRDMIAHALKILTAYPNTHPSTDGIKNRLDEAKKTTHPINFIFSRSWVGENLKTLKEHLNKIRPR